MRNNLTWNQHIAVSTDHDFLISAAGYLFIAIIWWMLGTLITGGIPLDIKHGVVSYMIYLFCSSLLFMTGVLSWIYKIHKLDSIIFLSMAVLFYGLFLIPLFTSTHKIFAGYYGFGALLLAEFFCYIWILSLRDKSGRMRSLFLLFFWMSALAAAICGWAYKESLEMLCGYLFLLSAVLAMIITAKEIFIHLGKNLSPSERISSPWEKLGNTAKKHASK